MRVLSAYTSFPNTPETDKQPLVMHDVILRDEVKPVRVMASDPIGAIDKVNAMTDEEVASLERVEGISLVPRS